MRIVDIDRVNAEHIDWDSPVAKQYRVRSVPAFQVYGPNGRLISSGRPAHDDVLKTLQEDLQ